ncbi:hypothetical protein BLNAU_16486 [Blattamonas nauphoetae]|uniref:Uncharacterized protein n=1 Tax=Blattamonas nauphoetae TaxID=2049346 RepID=A0ABQ9XBD4_9EUKA|nr:hypothetical protein BLNAU_16486 [Blattamonas nauphoetae]
MIRPWQVLFLVIVWTTSHSLDHIVPLEDVLYSSNQVPNQPRGLTLCSNDRSYHARNVALISTTLSLVGRHSELHHSSCLHPTSSTSETSSKTNEFSTINDAMCILKVRNSSVSLESWILHGEEANTIVCLVTSSQLMVRDSEIISNIDQSPFVVSMSNLQETTSIQIISCSHHSKSTNLLPLVDVARSPKNVDIDHSKAERNMKLDESGDSDEFEGDSICVVGSSLNLSKAHFPVGSGPLFSFGMRNDQPFSLIPADMKLTSTLTSSFLLNVTSRRTPLFENQNRFGSLQQQAIVGCCVSKCSNHDSGTTMLDANLGGNLACLNTSFSSCIRESNTAASYPNKNYTTSSQRFQFSDFSTITSATFTLCTFRNMITAVGSYAGGGAIFMKSGASLTVRQCSFHVCHVTAGNDDGGAINIECPGNMQNKLEIAKSAFTECKSTEQNANYGGCVFNRNCTLASISDSFFEKAEAQFSSAVAIYNISVATITNCSFVDCKATSSATLGIYMIASFDFLTSLLFRGCSAENVKASRDILFYHLTFDDVSSKISHCDSTSGAPNVYFQPTKTADSTLVPQITSTPTVEACTVTISGDEASVEVRTTEVIGGAMGILLEGLLVPRLVFVDFSTSGGNSTTGTATVSSGKNGVLPSADYTLRSFVLPGDVGSQLFSASAILKDANTTTITVKGVTLLEGSYSMLVQSNGVQVNISLTRTDSLTLTGDAPLYPSDAEGRLEWSTEYEIIRIEHQKDGTKNDIRRTNTLTFTTPSEQVRIASILSRSLNGQKDELSVVFSGFLLPTGTGTIQFKSLDSDAELECDLSIANSTTCSIVFPVGWKENTTHLLFGKTYSVQSASCKSVPIVIDSGVSFVVPSPPVITSFIVPTECSSDTFSVSVVGSNFPSGGTYTVSLSSSRSFEITFSTGTSGTERVKAGLPSEIEFNTTYSIVSVTKGGEHVLLNQTSVTTPLGPILEKVTTALKSPNKNNVLLTLTGSRMMTGAHTMTIVEQGESAPLSLSVSIDTATSGSGEEVVFGGSQLKYGKTYLVSSLTSKTLHFALDGSVSFRVPDEPARIVGIWASLDESGNNTEITVRGRQIAEGSYNVHLNSAEGPSFVVSFSDGLSSERNSSVASVSIFGSSPILSFDTIFTLFSVTPTSSPSDSLIIDADPSSFSIAEPARITKIKIGDFSDSLKTKATLTITGRALQPNTDYELHLAGLPKQTSSTTVNTEPHEPIVTIRTGSSTPAESGSKEVELYPHTSADLLFGYDYSVDSVSLDGSTILQTSVLSFSTPDQPARLSSIESCSLTSSKDGVVVVVKGFALKQDTTLMIVKSESGSEIESDGKIEVKSSSECWIAFKACWEENTTHLEFEKKYTLSVASGGSNDLVITPNLPFTAPSGPIVTSISAPSTCSSSSFSVGIVGTDLPIGSDFTIELVGDLSFLVDFDSSTTGNGTILASLPGQMQFDTEYSVETVMKGDRKVKCDSVSFRTPLGPTLMNVKAALNASNINNVILALESVRMPVGAMKLKVTEKDSTPIEMDVTFVSETEGFYEVLVFEGSSLKYGTTYTVLSLTSSTLHCSLDGTITFETPAAPPRIKTSSCCLVGELKRSGEVVLSGEVFPAGTPFSISLDEIDENGDVIPNTSPITLSDTFGGKIGDTALTTHSLTITLFPLPQSMKYSCRYRITSLTISSVLTAVEETAIFKVPAEPARIVGIWGELDESGNYTEITVRGRQIAEGSYNVRLNTPDGPSFVVSFDDEMCEERNSSVVSVLIFGSSPILSFDTTYTLFSVAPTSSPSDYLIIDANPNGFTTSGELARIVGIWGDLDENGNSTTIRLRGRYVSNGSYDVRLNSANGPSFVFTHKFGIYLNFFEEIII